MDTPPGQILRAASVAALLLLASACRREQADFTVLIEAAQAGDVHASRQELAKGFDGPNFNQISGQTEITPLHLAAAKGATDILQEFLDRGVAVDFTLQDGATPLHYAVTGRQVAAAQLLLARGANVEAPLPHGLTNESRPLDLAAQSGDLEMVRCLMKAGAKHYRNLGVGPLHLAAVNGHTAVVQDLIKAGARVDMTTAKLTRQNGHKATARVLYDELCRPLRVLPIPEVDDAVRQVNDSIRSIRRIYGCP